MSFEKFLLRDTAGKKSSTLTVFILGAIVVNMKLIFSGMTFAGITLSDFSGSDYGVAMGALGAIYVLRRSTSSEGGEKK